jgi:16S rRNA (uracil1498-N3)-methyltransferase
MTICDTVLLATPGEPEQAFAIGQAKGAGASVGLLVGPEGGFTDDEVERACGAGAVPFAWGERVLRADTAGIVLAALVLHAAEGFLQKEGS